LHAKHFLISEFGHWQMLLGAENGLEGLFDGHSVQLAEDTP